MFKLRGQLRIVVIDNGIGMDKDRLAEVERSWRARAIRTVISGCIIPIKGYGSDYGLTIRSKEGWGTTVMIDIPH